MGEGGGEWQGQGGKRAWGRDGEGPKRRHAAAQRAVRHRRARGAGATVRSGPGGRSGRAGTCLLLLLLLLLLLRLGLGLGLRDRLCLELQPARLGSRRDRARRAGRNGVTVRVAHVRQDCTHSRRLAKVRCGPVRFRCGSGAARFGSSAVPVRFRCGSGAVPVRSGAVRGGAACGTVSAQMGRADERAGALGSLGALGGPARGAERDACRSSVRAGGRAVGVGGGGGGARARRGAAWKRAHTSVASATRWAWQSARSARMADGERACGTDASTWKSSGSRKTCAKRARIFKRRMARILKRRRWSQGHGGAWGAMVACSAGLGERRARVA